MAADRTESRIVELDDLLVRPGTYFNPQTEVVVVVDDSTSIDQEIFEMEEFEGVDWVRISDEVPVDEDGLDTAIQRFQASAPGALGADVAEDEEPDAGADEEPELPEPVIEEPGGGTAGPWEGLAEPRRSRPKRRKRWRRSAPGAARLSAPSLDGRGRHVRGPSGRVPRRSRPQDGARKGNRLLA
jgi:hypothetical protein